LSEARAKSAIESSRLYIASAMPALGACRLPLDHLAILADEFHRQRALAGEFEVGGTILVAEGVAADNDRLVQPGTSRGTFLQMMGSRTPHRQNVADGAVRRFPHLLGARIPSPGLHQA